MNSSVDLPLFARETSMKRQIFLEVQLNFSIIRKLAKLLRSPILGNCHCSMYVLIVNGEGLITTVEPIYPPDGTAFPEVIREKFFCKLS